MYDSLVSCGAVNKKILLIPAKTLEKEQLNSSGSGRFHVKTRVNLKHFVTDCFWITFLDSYLPQAPSNLIFLAIVATLSSFTSFSSKVRAIKLQKRAKTLPTWQLGLWYFHWCWGLVLKEFKVCFRMFSKNVK